MNNKNKKCDLEILRGINGTAVYINGYRVTDSKIYGMLVTESHYKINVSNVFQALSEFSKEEGDIE